MKIFVQSVIFAGHQQVVLSFVTVTYCVKYHEVLESLEDVAYGIDPGYFNQIVEAVCLKSDQKVETLFSSEEQAYPYDDKKEDNSQGVGFGGKGGYAGT